jgi:hypothetical protein
VLGALQAEYRHGRAFALKAWLLGPAVMLLGLGGIVGLVLAPPDDRAGFWTMAVCWLLALCLAALGGALPVAWLRGRSLRVQVYEHGVVQVLRGQRSQVLWNDVERLRIEAMSLQMNGIPAGGMRVYHLEPRVGPALQQLPGRHRKAGGRAGAAGVGAAGPAHEGRARFATVPNAHLLLTELARRAAR